MSGQQCIFLLHILGRPSKGRDAAGHAPVREDGQFNQRELLILQALDFLSLGVGLAGLLCVSGLQKHPTRVSIHVRVPEHLKPFCSW